MDEKQLLKLRESLASYVLEQNWQAVVAICGHYPWLCGESITRLFETALHFAALQREERIVRQLVEIIHSRRDADEAVRVLSKRNKEGNTPLHLAVIVGKVEMCRCICDGRPQLLGVRNDEGETPLFLAAGIGEMDAFACLLNMDTKECFKIRNREGDTILHCAISREQWKLAFLILERFPHLGNSINEKGETPLHLLAEKPGAFRSGTYLSPFDKLIYHCVGNVLPSSAPHGHPQRMINIPENSEGIGGGSTHEGEAGSRTVPTNYDTCMTFINLMATFICIISGFEGLNYVKKIKKKKETNVLSEKILHELLTGYRDYVTSRLIESLTFALPGSVLDGQGQEQSNQGDDRAVLVSLQGKDSLRGDRIIIAGGKDGLGANPIIVAADRSADPIIVDGPSGKRLYNELCTKAMMEVRAVETPATFLKNNDNTFPDIDEKLLHIYPISTLDPDKAEKNPIIVAGSAAEHLFRSAQDVARSRKSYLMTPFLLAAQNGIREMVHQMLEKDSRSIHDLNLEYKNAMLLAVEKRQPQVCRLLLKRYGERDPVFRTVDTDGCNALHLVARLSPDRPSFILGSALEMQQEVLWYEYVKGFMPPYFFSRRNNMNETANEIFMKDHKELLAKGKRWVKDTANACSVVGTFIAAMAFTASTTTPGGIKEGSQKLDLQHQAAFHIFAVTSYITLSFSISSVVMFLATFISRNNVSDFARDLPVKLLLGLTCLFISILSMLVTSFAGLFFLPKDFVRIPGLVMFAVASLPATYFAVAQLPLYVELIWATFRSVPQRWVEEAWW